MNIINKIFKMFESPRLNVPFDEEKQQYYLNVHITYKNGKKKVERNYLPKGYSPTMGISALHRLMTIEYYDYGFLQYLNRKKE